MTNKDHQLLVRSLIDKIGPVDMNLVIGADRMPNGKYVIKINGKRAEDNEVNALKREAELFEQMGLYRMLTETLRYQTERRMFVDFQGKNEDIYEAGKYLLHAISTLEHLIWAAKNPTLLADERVVHKGGNRAIDKRRASLNN